MTPRTEKLRQESLEARPSISSERARLVTEFYQANEGKYSAPVMRAKCFYYLCQHKTIYIGPGELIVGERGPRPKATPTYPELTCHSLEDLEILNSRPLTRYEVDEECFSVYRDKVIPYWRGRSLRDKIFAELPQEWNEAYQAGIFTEFMEQRAPGHTVLDDKIYSKGMLDFKRDIAEAMSRLDFLNDPLAWDKRETLKSFDIACDAIILFAQRHAELARALAEKEADPNRRAELLKVAEACSHVPAHAPRNFHEALQYYWFCHLGVITELNGWDSFNPGHLDQHLLPFYRRGLENGTLTPESARELLECFFIKFNNQPAPPKVGVTAAESGTYTDFANINIGGLLRDGSDGSNELSHLILDIIDEMHLLQPSSNLQLSRKTPDELLKHALRVVRKGYGFPSIFNADAVVEEQLRMGKSLEDARAGGCSGCVEVGAFGKEAYILTGYFNMPKCLELALHNGVDPLTGKQLGPRTGDPDSFKTFDELYEAYRKQFRHFLDIKLRGNQLIGRMYATLMPAPFLSVLIDDCIKNACDYNAGGARYNNTYVQFVGLGSLTDSFSVLKQVCFDDVESAPGSRVALDGSSNETSCMSGASVQADGASGQVQVTSVLAGRQNLHASGVCSPSHRSPDENASMSGAPVQAGEASGWVQDTSVLASRQNLHASGVCSPSHRSPDENASMSGAPVQAGEASGWVQDTSVLASRQNLHASGVCSPSHRSPDENASMSGAPVQAGEASGWVQVTSVLASRQNPHASGVRSPSDGRDASDPDGATSCLSVSGARYSKRNLPHFEKPWAIYHVTLSTVSGRKLAPEDRDIVLDCILYWHQRRYRLYAACVMPDHVHLILQPGIESQTPDGKPVFYSLGRIFHTIKSYTAHRINERTNTTGALWEKESFDRYIRSDADLEEKFHYVCRNPWDSGVVSPDQPYPWLWTPDMEGITRGSRVALDGSPNANSCTTEASLQADGSPGQGQVTSVLASRQNPHASGVCSRSHGTQKLKLSEFLRILDADFEGYESFRQWLINKTHKYGNDDDYADSIAVRIFETCVEELDGRPDPRGGNYRVEMLPTTCHVYFGSKIGALPDGRKAGKPLSEGISPVQGADRTGPTAVLKSAAKFDHIKAGGTLLNMKLSPSVVSSDEALAKWAALIRAYFKMDTHHVQFNIVTADTLRNAQANPGQYRNLIVRVAGYSDYFCDLSRELQDEIIQRTEHTLC